MFNVTKALKKLIECSIGDGIKHCGYVTFAELKAIFESGRSDEPETMFATACCELMKRVASIEERLARLEQSIVKSDNRLSRLEEAVRLIQFDNDIEPEKPVTEQLDKNAVKCANCGLVHDVDYLHACPEKEIPTLAPEYIIPSKPSEPMAHYSEYGVEIGKPSECCSCKKPGQTIWVDNLKNPVCKDFHKPVFSKSEFITPHQCVSDGMVYTSNPPQNRCKICGKFWYV